MRSRRGLAFRPSLAVSVRLECLEDRRLLSALGGSSGAEDLPTGNSSQFGGDSAVVMSVNASQANASGTDSPGDSSVSVVNVVYTAANDGESSGAQAQGTASSSDFAGPTSATSASTISDLGETTASPSAELAQTTPTAASAPSASKGTTSGLGVTTPSPSAPLPQTTSTAVVNRGFGIGSSSAAEQTPGDEATTNLSSGTSSSSQAELTPADEGVSAAEQTPGDEATNLSSGTSSSSQAELTPADEGVGAASASGSVPDALISRALSAGAGVAPSGADSTGAGAGSAGLAAAPNIAVGLAIARPAFDSPLEHAPQTEGLYLSPARAAVSHATIAANPALTGEVLGGWEAGALPETESLDMETGAGDVEMPSLRYSDLLTEFLPFDRSFVENAIDRFLDRFESLGGELTDLRETTNLVPAVAATALTALAVEVALRRWRARDEANGAPAEDVEEELARFAGFPNLWSLGEP